MLDRNPNTKNIIAQNAADFVKYVAPFGSNNREDQGDVYRRKGQEDSSIVDSLVTKIHGELNAEIGCRSLSDLKDILLIAEKTLKYGAGNCSGQSAVSFVFLLSQGILNLEYKQTRNHAFIEFVDSMNSNSEIIVLDAWDDKTIYSYPVNLKRSPHTGMRFAYSYDSVINFNFSDFHRLGVIKFHVIKFEEIKNYYKDECIFLKIDDENICVYQCKDIREFFKEFLLKGIESAVHLDVDEKKKANSMLESCQQQVLERKKNIEAAKRIQFWYRRTRDENQVLNLIENKETSVLAQQIYARRHSKK